MASDLWGADAPISMPEPPDRPSIVKVGEGFAMTTGGITLDLDEGDREEMFFPNFAPAVEP